MLRPWENQLDFSFFFFFFWFLTEPGKSDYIRDNVNGKEEEIGDTEEMQVGQQLTMRHT